MSLHDICDGLLETSVTWEEFEELLSSALDTGARLGANKEVVDIGEGNGFASKCALITCDWLGAAEDEKLPKKVVLKIPSSLPFRKLNDALPEGQKMYEGDETVWEMLEDKLRDFHNTEVCVYELFDGIDGLALPKMYYGTQFGEEKRIGGQICLEFMENSRMMNFHEQHTVQLLKQIARAIGELNACSLKKEATAPELKRDFFSDFDDTLTFEAYTGTYKGVYSLDGSEKTRELMIKIESLLPDYFQSNLPCTIHQQMGFRPVLVNGDMRTENILIDAETGDLRALIDWQSAHLGVGVEDLHRIAMFALTTEDRRAHFPMLIEEMYKSMVENLDGAEPPYSLNTLHLLSDLLFPHCALFFANGCVALISNQSKDPRLSDDEKAKRKEVQMDKLIGALEDILFFHEKNKKHAEKPKFKTPLIL